MLQLGLRSAKARIGMYVPRALTKRADIDAVIHDLEQALGQDVLRIRYDVGQDWTGEWAIFFRVLLTDDAAKHRLREIATREDLEHWIQDEQEWQQEHLVAWLFGAFAILALALAATGLYSVVSFSVAQRTNEFGIRMALGALPADVLRIVFASALVSVGTGLAAGIVLSFTLSSLLAKWAEGSSRDILVLLATTTLLSLVAALACAAPARRASAVDP